MPASHVPTLMTIHAHPDDETIGTGGASGQDGPYLRVSNWLTTWDFKEPIDAGLIGVPYSAASISPGSKLSASVRPSPHASQRRMTQLLRV